MNIKLFETNRGDRPVEKFVRDTDPAATAKIMRQIDLLEHYGPKLSLPHAKKITSQLYELRIRGRQEVRILYAFVGRGIVLLHAFYKKRQKLPGKDIKVAEARFKQLTTL